MRRVPPVENLQRKFSEFFVHFYKTGGAQLCLDAAVERTRHLDDHGFLGFLATSVNGVSDIPENLRGSAAGMALPAFPALSKAQTMPSSGFVRKRSDSESDSEDLKASKLARTHRSKSVRYGCKRWLSLSCI